MGNVGNMGNVERILLENVIELREISCIIFAFITAR